MAPLDSLPDDQRAVLELVLQRGRSYDEIAKVLSVDRAGVRQRALAAFDAIGPQTQIPPERRALIADYLLGQLPTKVSDTVRDRLGSSPSERAWARMLASELGPISRDPLPEIPVAPADGATPSTAGAARSSSSPGDSAATAPVAGHAGESGSPPASGSGAARSPLSPGPRRSSRVGGAILLIAGALIVIAVVVVLIVALSGGSSSKRTSSAAAQATSTSTPATGTSGTSTSTAKVVAQVNLLPTGAASKAKGIAQVIRVGNSQGIVVYAKGMPPNTKSNFYAVWLFNSPGDEYFLGFVSPGVGANGQLQTTGALPPNTAHFKNVLVSLETQKKPKTPSQIILHGSLTVQ